MALLLVASLSCPFTIPFVGGVTLRGIRTVGNNVGATTGRELVGDGRGRNVAEALNIGTDVVGTGRGATDGIVTGNDIVGDESGANVVTFTGNNVVVIGGRGGVGFGAVTTGLVVTGGMTVPSGLVDVGMQTGVRTGAGIPPVPLFAIHCRPASMPTQSPLNRFEQSKYGTNSVSEIF